MSQTFEIEKTGDSFKSSTAWLRWWRRFEDGIRFHVSYTKVPDTPFEKTAAKLRKYYFGHVVSEIMKETTHSKDTIHTEMKRKYTGEIDEKTGFMVTKSVFSFESEMTLDERWDFIMAVRTFASDFMNIITADPDPCWKETVIE